MDGADRVTVSDASDFSIGDTVLIIQMKGIEINVSNDKDFGSELSLSSAGKYEFITITGISGNQIVFSTNLYNTYNPNDDVQLIRVPGFSNNLTVAGTITCEPFDSTSGTGGVVAMIVGNTLTLNADIDASYMGFSGGLAVNGDATCGNTDYFYDAASDKSGFKGEGAASYGPGMVPLGTNYSKGRGPLYQGGGGGNGKHSGGAGGGNYGEGGSGGSESGDCGPNDHVGGLPGLSIKPLSFEAEKRIFLGGGGGSGTHTGTLISSSGGRGGGIVIIIANTIIGNGYSIKANGESVTDIVTSGGGGGGAGGSVLLGVSNYSGNHTIEVTGGNGGDVNGTICSGAGGGGGAGLIWYSETPPAGVDLLILKGYGGYSYNACNGLQHGFDGRSGKTLKGLEFSLTGLLLNAIFSSTTGQASQRICASDIIPAPINGATIIGGQPPYTFQWQSRTDLTAWIDVPGANTEGYSFSIPLSETTHFRRIVRDSGVPLTSVSNEVSIIVSSTPLDVNAGPDQVICDGEMITLSGSGAQTYIWDNGVTDRVPFTQPIGTNVYTVIGTDNTGCSNSDQVTVTVHSLPIVTAQASASELCYGASLTLTGSGANTYTWNDGITDGVPFVPSETSIYTVMGTDVNGCFSYSQIEVAVNKVDNSVTVNNNTLTANATQASYQWKDCGTNQSISGEINNSFTPTLTGTYAVEVTQNGCVDISSCYEVTITGINENTFGSELVVYPNPVTELLNIDLGERYNEIFIRVLNLAGKEVLNKSFKQQQLIELELNNIPDGLYFINIKTEDKYSTIKVVKKKKS